MEEIGAVDTGARKNETHVRLKCLYMRHHDKLFKAMHFFHPWFNNINVSSMLKKIYLYLYISYGSSEFIFFLIS